ncbi:DNA-binding XRE family transcriptional regulator [Frondihabitans sp. PhB161]|nr:DNA-binding XRE family transcriptional regulator [Frondihabitans sp. PhB153]RPF08139.1 DNA-binding XRE family transcriptional regulator [Frondihabitans sp. PhB161]
MTATNEPNLDALRGATVSLRVARGLSVDDLHTRSGIARSMLFRIENGSATGSLVTWFRIAQALEVPLSDLVQHLESPR